MKRLRSFPAFHLRKLCRGAADRRAQDGQRCSGKAILVQSVAVEHSLVFGFWFDLQASGEDFGKWKSQLSKCNSCVTKYTPTNPFFARASKVYSQTWSRKSLGGWCIRTYFCTELSYRACSTWRSACTDDDTWNHTMRVTFSMFKAEKPWHCLKLLIATRNREMTNLPSACRQLLSFPEAYQSVLTKRKAELMVKTALTWKICATTCTHTHTLCTHLCLFVLPQRPQVFLNSSTDHFHYARKTTYIIFTEKCLWLKLSRKTCVHDSLNL